jgi:hypothetical protein
VVAQIGRLAKRRAIRRAANEAMTVQIFQRPFDPRPDPEGSAGGYGDSHGPWIERDDPEISHFGDEVHEPSEDLFGGSSVSVLSDVSALAPSTVRRPRDLQPVLIAFVVAAVVAIVVCAVLLLLHGPRGEVEQSTTVAPSPTNSTSTPSTIEPTQASAPVEPPAPPPPPQPPSAEQLSPGPGYGGSNHWPRSSPSPSDNGPQINVTRAPMSVAPSTSRPGPKTNSATPGDAPRRGGFHF